MFFWLPMSHLPHPPQHFVDRAHVVANNQSLPDMVGHMSNDTHRKRTINYQGKSMQTRCQQSRDMGQDWDQWVRENIVPDFLETGVRVSYPVSDTHGAHTDSSTKWKLYYLLERGGDDAETKFYKEPGQPLERLESEHGVACNNMDSLIELESVQWPLNQWVLLNTRILHGVTQVPKIRYNFTVSIKPCELSTLFRV